MPVAYAHIRTMADKMHESLRLGTEPRPILARHADIRFQFRKTTNAAAQTYRG